MTRKIVVEFDGIIPSHITPEKFSQLLTDYILLFRFTTQICKIELFPINTSVTITPIFDVRNSDAD